MVVWAVALAVATEMEDLAVALAVAMEMAVWAVDLPTDRMADSFGTDDMLAAWAMATVSEAA
jgi:hypothetical protein